MYAKMIEDLKIANWKLTEKAEKDEKDAAASEPSGMMSPAGFSDKPRNSTDNRQFLEIDLKEEAKTGGNQNSYYSMAFGNKEEAKKTVPPRRSPSPKDDKSESDDDEESESSKTFKTITERP